MQHEFKPFDKVLTRHGDLGVWRLNFYSHLSENGEHVCMWGKEWERCLPFEGNEHLLNTCNNPEPKFKTGDKVVVSSSVSKAPFLSRSGTYEAIYVREGGRDIVNGRLMTHYVVVRGDDKVTEWDNCEHADW